MFSSGARRAPTCPNASRRKSSAAPASTGSAGSTKTASMTSSSPRCCPCKPPLMQPRRPSPGAGGPLAQRLPGNHHPCARHHQLRRQHRLQRTHRPRHPKQHPGLSPNDGPSQGHPEPRSLHARVDLLCELQPARIDS